MESTGIKERIRKIAEEMILSELSKLKLGKHDADRVWQYRDANFLDGSYDYFFDKYVEDKKLVY
jgi:hypothetical protein